MPRKILEKVANKLLDIVFGKEEVFIPQAEPYLQLKPWQESFPDRIIGQPVGWLKDHDKAYLSLGVQVSENKEFLFPVPVWADSAKLFLLRDNTEFLYTYIELGSEGLDPAFHAWYGITNEDNQPKVYEIPYRLSRHLVTGGEDLFYEKLSEHAL